MVEKPQDPEDILESSLTSLYQLSPFAVANAGAIFNFQQPLSSISVTVLTPDPQAKNWSLHASNIWVSGVFLAKHIDRLDLDHAFDTAVNLGRRFEVLELGAGSGLPGIVIAKYLSLYGKQQEGRKFRVTLSDYPDDKIVDTLRFNVLSNNLQEGTCRVVPHAWGDSTSSLLSGTGDSSDADESEGFDLIVAADTLWNVATHDIFIKSLSRLLRRSSDARIHLIAGLHTGRYSIERFLRSIQICAEPGADFSPSFCVEKVEECEVDLDSDSQTDFITREWCPDRSDSEPNDNDRRRWVVWIVLRWVDLVT